MRRPGLTCSSLVRSGVALALLAATAAPAAATQSATAGPLDRSPRALATAVAPMLQQRAAAFARHDVAAFMATVDPRDAAFAARQRALVTNAAQVPFATYRLEPDVEDVADLSRARDRQRFGADTVVLDVRETYELAGGYDTGAAATEDLFLTLVRDSAGRWKVAGDTAVEDVGLLSTRHAWDFAPIRTRASEHFLALYPDNQAGEVAAVLSEAEAALRRVLPVWTPKWNAKVAIELPKDVESLGRRIQATFPLDNFVAFAYSTGDLIDLRLSFGGRRVMVNPRNFLGNSAASRRTILAHELVHVATRESSGAYLTAWLEEGVAQLLGEGASAVGLGSVREALRSGAFTGRAPEDFQFVTGGAQRIYRSYAEAYLLAREIEKIAGRAGLIRFYVAAGNAGRLGPGVGRVHLDAASRNTLGVSLTELERRWAADVRADRLR